VVFVAISGFSALGLAYLYRMLAKTQARKALPAVYAGIMAIAFFALPNNPDQITAPMDLVISFRVATALTMSMFWGLLGAILGALWDRAKPHETKMATA
jgi:predicted cobalt transporter CbtA